MNYTKCVHGKKSVTSTASVEGNFFEGQEMDITHSKGVFFPFPSLLLFLLQAFFQLVSAGAKLGIAA